MNWLSRPILGNRSHRERARWRAAFVAPLLLVLALAGCERLTTTTQSGDNPMSARSSGGGMTCVAPSKPSPAGGCVTTDAATGISVRVTDAYADVTGTLAHLVTANTYNYPLMINGQLTLRSGVALQAAEGGYWGSDAIIVDEPLPADVFAPHVELIAIAHFEPPEYHGMYPPALPPAPPWLNHLDRLSIRVPFTLSPPRGGGFTYHMAPTVMRGIGVQVQSLDYSPEKSAFFGTAGGARVELLFTGLPADLELLSFIRVKSERALKDGGTSGDRGPSLVTLHIPGMTLGSPVMTLLQSPRWPAFGNQTSEEPVVGPAGTVQFEVAFLGSGKPAGQPATLTISGIQRLTGGMDPTTASNIPTLPTYQITLPMK